MILVKVHRAGMGEVICLCDADLIGKKFEQGDKQLDVTESFYKSEEIPKKKMLTLTQTSRNLGITGKESIAFTIKHHIIEKESVIIIQGIPHAQVI